MHTKTIAISLVIIAIIAVLFALKTATDLIAPLLLAVFITIIFSGLIQRLDNFGMPHKFSILLIVLLLVVAVLFIVSVIGNSVGDFQSKAVKYQESLALKMQDIVLLAERFDIDVDQFLTKDLVETSGAMNLTIKLLRSMTDIFGSGFTLILTVIFMLIETSQLGRKIHKEIGFSKATLAKIDFSLTQLRHYLSIKFTTSCITGVGVYLLLLLLGVDFPLLWGFVAFVLNFIPSIGSIVAAVPVIILAWVQLDVVAMLWVAVGYLIINLIIGNVVEPRMMNNTLGLSLLAIFLSLIFWGWIFGLIGMFLSVPLTMACKIILDSFDKTRPIAVLLS